MRAQIHTLPVELLRLIQSTRVLEDVGTKEIANFSFNNTVERPQLAAITHGRNQAASIHTPRITMIQEFMEDQIDDTTPDFERPRKYHARKSTFERLLRW
jgi:hypothetical protein